MSDLKAAIYSRRLLRVAGGRCALHRVHLAGAKQRFNRSGAGDGLDVARPNRLAAG